MGILIESVAARRARRGPLAPGALPLIDAAARACLEGAHRRADELDLLVNAGLYKDKNIWEPAMASLIQEDIGANLGHPSRRGHHGTFSFDATNGGCGVLTGLHIIDTFVGSGAARLGMVVAGDSDPAPRISRAFPFPPVAGAVLLRHCDNGEGFAGFEFRTFPEHSALFEVRVNFDPAGNRGLFGHSGRNILEVHEDPRFAALCVQRATEVTVAFLDRAKLRVDDVDVLVASPYPPGFAGDLARAVGVAADRVPELPPELASAHTAGPIAALQAAVESGRFARARNVLFVTAGAGITIAVAHYRR